MMDIATWAREHFGKSLSLNTVRRCIKKCNLKLYYAKRKHLLILRGNQVVLGSGSSEIDRKTVETCSACFVLDVGFFVLKMKKTIPAKSAM